MLYSTDGLHMLLQQLSSAADAELRACSLEMLNRCVAESSADQLTILRASETVAVIARLINVPYHLFPGSLLRTMRSATSLCNLHQPSQASFLANGGTQRVLQIVADCSGDTQSLLLAALTLLLALADCPHNRQALINAGCVSVLESHLSHSWSPVVSTCQLLTKQLIGQLINSPQTLDDCTQALAQMDMQ